MVDVKNPHRVTVVVDLVAHPVLPAARPPVPVKGGPERRPHPTRRCRKRPRDELPGGKGRGGGKEVGQGAPSPRGKDQLIGRFSHRQPQPAA